MDIRFLEFTLPLWWILPAIAVAAGLSYILYKKKGMPWNENQNMILGGLRFLSILLILLLLLNPFIRQVLNEVERPLVVIGLDNSSSLSAIHNQDELDEIVSSIKTLEEELVDQKDYQVELVSLSEEDSLSFEGPLSDLSDFFKRLEAKSYNRNLKAVVIATDGIYNRGISPLYKPYSYPVFSLGLGDTIPPRDVVIEEARNNAVAYSGNEFPIHVGIGGDGYEGQEFSVVVKERGVVLDSKEGVFGQGRSDFVFLLSADEPGLKHYRIEVTEFDGEVTVLNNTRDVFIEVLESKKRILIAANSPYPDIRAIRSVLEETGNYEVTVYIKGFGDAPEEASYDVQILLNGAASLPGKSGIWRINSDDRGADLSSIPFIKIDPQGQPDEVTPAYNSNFSKFKLNQEIDRLDGYPPISVPYGDYNLSGPHEILFYQRVGSVVTDKPLVAVFDDGNQRQAVSVGQGIWQWRLQESASEGDVKLFSEFVQKMVQYLSIDDSKKQFRVTNGLEVFTDGEVVFFDVEIYDDIFQPLEGQPYSLEIRNEADQIDRFDFVYGSENKTARTTTFAPGTYSYTAKTTIGEDELIDRGEFLINSLQLEQLELTADHQMLRQLSVKTNGDHFHLDEFEQMRERLLASDYKGTIHSETTRTPLVETVWILLLIAGLLSAEWVLRKYWGAF